MIKISYHQRKVLPKNFRKTFWPNSFFGFHFLHLIIWLMELWLNNHCQYNTPACQNKLMKISLILLAYKLTLWIRKNRTIPEVRRLGEFQTTRTSGAAGALSLVPRFARWWTTSLSQPKMLLPFPLCKSQTLMLVRWCDVRSQSMLLVTTLMSVLSPDVSPVACMLVLSPNVSLIPWC